MKYEIFGDNMPAATCHMKAGETLICTAGAMAWMEPGMEMQTEEDSFEKMVGRFFSGDSLMHTQGLQVEVLSTKAVWFGVTYKEDKEYVAAELKKLHEDGSYPAAL